MKDSNKGKPEQDWVIKLAKGSEEGIRHPGFAAPCIWGMEETTSIADMVTLREVPAGNGMAESGVPESPGYSGEKPLASESDGTGKPCPLLNH